MPQDHTQRLSSPRLYFVSGLTAGLLVGVVAGYMVHGLLADAPEAPASSDDLWYPRGIDRGLDDYLVPSDAPSIGTSPTPGIWDERGGLSSDDALPPGGSAPVVPSADPSDEPSPGNASEGDMSPGGARLPDDPSSAFDAPEP